MRNTLDQVSSQQSERMFYIMKEVALVVGASLLMAISGRLVIPLPFTPIPLALSNFTVLLIGLSLGPTRSFLAMVIYLTEGAAGAPVFSPLGPGGMTQLLGPTGGYLLSYPFVAALAGFLGGMKNLRQSRPSFGRLLVAGISAELLLFACGISWIMVMMGATLHQASYFGLYPFLFAEVIKVMVAAAACSRLNRSQRFAHLVS